MTLFCHSPFLNTHAIYYETLLPIFLLKSGWKFHQLSVQFVNDKFDYPFFECIVRYQLTLDLWEWGGCVLFPFSLMVAPSVLCDDNEGPSLPLLPSTSSFILSTYSVFSSLLWDVLCIVLHTLFRISECYFSFFMVKKLIFFNLPFLLPLFIL